MRGERSRKKDTLLADNDDPEGGIDFPIIRGGRLKSDHGVKPFNMSLLRGLYVRAGIVLRAK